MKKMMKIFLTAGVTLVLGGGVVMSYLQTQRPQEVASDLTLANIEALGAVESDDVVLCLGGWAECATNGTTTLFKEKKKQ